MERRIDMAMDPKIELFCAKAIKRGLVSEVEIYLLREMCTEEESTLKGFVRLALQFKVSSDSEGLLKLADEVSESWEGLSAEDRTLASMEYAIADKEPARGDTTGLDWFAFFAISEGGLTKDICVSIASEIEDLTDVLAFAQAAIDNWMSSDYSKIQKCVDKAMVMVKKNAKPPFTIFGSAPMPVSVPDIEDASGDKPPIADGTAVGPEPPIHTGTW